MFGKTKFNFLLNLSSFIVFAVTALTGLFIWSMPDGPGSSQQMFLAFTKRDWTTLHDWAGVSMLASALLHIVLHWKWIVCVANRYFQKTSQAARLNFSLNALLFSAFVLANVSGLVAWLILPGGGFRGGRNPLYNAAWLSLERHAWNDLHLWAGLAMIAIMVVHLAQHWKWIVNATRNFSQLAAVPLPSQSTTEECTV